MTPRGMRGGQDTAIRRGADKPPIPGYTWQK